MSTNNILTPTDKVLNEDSMISSSTTISVSEPITQDISKNKNVYLIPRNIEQRITEILSFLQSDTNLANTKIPVLKYLQSLFLSVEFNSEIFSRKSINDKEKLNLYKVIIHQYIFYTNPNNSKADEDNYRSDLQNLFILLLSQVTFEKDNYHYILSPMINFLNEKNILNSNKKSSTNNLIENEQIVNFKSEHLARVLILLKYFYVYYKNEKSCLGIPNYIFFSGDSDSSITIRNKESTLDQNKKLLNLDETLCIMMFIKVLPSEYIKAVYPKITFKLLELNFKDKNEGISINIDIENNLTGSFSENPLLKLKENETNCVIIKFNAIKKKSIINCQIFVGSEKTALFQIPLIDSEKEKNPKTKDEIKDIVLFKNFIGICSNIIIYKEKKNEGLPKILFPYNDKQKGETNDNNKSGTQPLFPNGIYSEGLYSYFANAEMIEQQDNIVRKINIVNSDQKINYNIFREFLANNLISIYIPTRYTIPVQNEDKTLHNTSQIILVDSINGLNAEFNTRTPALNGIHIFQNLYEDDLSILGGINNLLPILELMLNNNELLNKENFASFFDLLTVYVLSPKYQKALSMDNSNFFKSLSYFLESLPEEYFNGELVENIRTILMFLCPPGEDNNYKELKNQFYDYILTNEKILLKFNEENQKNLINQISNTVGRSDLNADIIKIIRVMLSYDKNRNNKFCCKTHSEYFNENYAIMEPELHIRLKPLENLLKVFFDKIYKSTMKLQSGILNNTQTNKKSNKTIRRQDSINYFQENDLYYIFYLLTYNISPCLQKSIISVILHFLTNKGYEQFLNIFDRRKELFEIILFIFKTSITDVKIEAIHLLLLMDSNNKWSNLKNENIKTFIKNELLPVFLLDEANDLNNEKNKEEIKDINKDENKENTEEKKELNEEENDNEENKNKFGIKPEVFIDKVKYRLFCPLEAEKKIAKKYNKAKYNFLVNNLYNQFVVYIYNSSYTFELIIKIISNGDLSTIDNFLSKIGGIIQSPDSKKNDLYRKLYNEIINKNYFLQFVLDTYLQLFILENNKDKNKVFIPAFPLDLTKKLNNSQLKEESLNDLISKVSNNCYEIILFILTENITNFDYVLTWGKYYEKIKEENDIYKYIYEIVDKLLLGIFTGGNKTIVTFSSLINLNDTRILTSVYFLDIYFEFITFFKLEYDNSFFQMDKLDIYKNIEKDLKYILCRENTQEIEDLTLIQELETNVNKIKNFFFTSIISTFYPIWKSKELIEKENDLYYKQMKNSINKGTFTNEVDFLFHSFDDKFFRDNGQNICNKGMNMIGIIYHILICLLNIGGVKKEIYENFMHFRLYLTLLIICQPTINISDAIKKKKWKNEHKYEEITNNIYIILFNSIYFLYNKLQNLKIQEKEYNSKTEEEKEKDKKTLDCILILRRIYMENLGYLLKLLNKIYRGVRQEEIQFKGSWNIFTNKTKAIERIKNTGAFFFMNEFYNECFITHIPISNPEQSKKKKQELRKYSSPTDINYNTESQQKVEVNENIDELKEKESNDLPEVKLNMSDSNIKEKEENEKSEENKNILNTSNISDIMAQKEEELRMQNSLNLLGQELNFIDDLSNTINFIPDKAKEIALSDEDFKSLETYINQFLENEKIKNYFEKYYEKNIKDLYSFIPTIKIRQEKIKTIIPFFDNRKNIKRYPYDVCLIPYYYQENDYKQELIKKIEMFNMNLKEEVKLSSKVLEANERINEKIYKNVKKKMFKFRGIWSYEDFFYDYKKYKLKYKILNHYTNDLTKIMMTPITDIDYYLPKFSKFKGEIFRNELSEASLFPITKITEICFSKSKENQDTDNTPSEPQQNQLSEENNNNNNTPNINEIIPIYELNQEYFNFLKGVEVKDDKKAENYATNFNPKDYKIFTKFIEKKHLINRGQSLQCDACLVKLSSHIRGIMYINNNEIGFYSYETKRTEEDEDFDLDKKTCFGSIFQDQKEKYNTYHIHIPFKQIEFMLKRRFYFKKNVLEIFVQNKKSYFFRIDEHKFDEFFNAIISNNKKAKNICEFEDVSIETDKKEEKIGLVNKSNLLYNYNNYHSLFFSKKLSTTKNLYIKWTKWEISTFTLLNYINQFASRSYHDTNQYPVFPWIITDYKSKALPDLTLDNLPENINSSDYIPKIRPLGTPMGMLGLGEESKDRRDNYLMNFESPDEKNPDENYDRYGSHYSTGLHLTYYLVRVFPFSYLRIEIQGKNFDDPNRLFNSLENSFENAVTQKSDLRELIPEFFCLPEMFYNMNDLNLGEIFDEKIKKNILVNNILMPPWANNDAYIFIKYHREMLESPEVSEKIHEWFNIIFGSKQKGKSAKKIHNLFNVQTYDDFDERHKNADPSDKIYQNRMVEFGVTPSQVFKSDVDKRMLVKNLRKKPILYEFQTKKEKNMNIFSLNEENEIKIRESELYIEGTPYKMFSSWKKEEENKHEKILFLYNDKVKIISRSEKSFFKKTKTSNKNVSTKDLIKTKENIIKQDDKENKENKELQEIKENKEEKKENEENKDNKETNEIKQINSLEDKDMKNSNSIEEDYSEINNEEINEMNLNKDVSKYDRILISPKYRMDIHQSPAVIYDKGNYIALGGYWNGKIIINKLEDNEKIKKNKSLKNINIISSKGMSPITIMKIDESETFVICANKLGNVLIYAIDEQNKIDWTLFKIIQDNQKEITSLDLNENLNIFITSDREGYNNLYTFPECKLFNSYKLNENQFPSNNTPNDNNSSSISRSESNLNLTLTQNDIFADMVIISHNPLPCVVFYIRVKKCLCVFSINFHFIKAVYGIELVPNGIKKYSDYFRKDYLFIYNNVNKTIDIYDIINLEIISKSSRFEYTFVDFYFSKGMELALIMVKIDDGNSNENTKDKNAKNYKILMMNTPGKADEK